MTIISFALIQCSHQEQECQCNPKVFAERKEEKARARIPLIAINFESRDSLKESKSMMILIPPVEVHVQTYLEQLDLFV